MARISLLYKIEMREKPKTINGGREMSKYTVHYTDSNGAINVIDDLTTTTEIGAKREATRRAPAMHNITLYQDDYPVAHRNSWRNPNGHFGLNPWEET